MLWRAQERPTWYMVPANDTAPSRLAIRVTIGPVLAGRARRAALLAGEDRPDPVGEPDQRDLPALVHPPAHAGRAGPTSRGCRAGRGLPGRHGHLLSAGQAEALDR